MSPIPSRNALARIGLTAALLASSVAMAPAQETQTAPAAPAVTAPAADPDTVIATIDGRPVTEADVALAEADLDQQFAQLPPEQRRVAALSALVEIRLLAAEGEKNGLGDADDFKHRMAFLRERALHSAYVETAVQAAVTDEAVRARYDKEIAAAPAQEEVRARHILVNTKEEADAIIKQLDEGGDFEAIAKDKSGDPGSGAQGGDLGYFAQGQMVPEFEQAAFAMEIGAHSKTPVQSQFGFHVIKVEDKRSKQPPAYDAVKEQVRGLVLRDKYFEIVKGFRDGAKVEISDPALKTAFDAMSKAQEQQ